jgi:hypothetical protein
MEEQFNMSFDILGRVIRCKLTGPLDADNMLLVNKQFAELLSAQTPLILVDMSEITSAPKNLKKVKEAAEILLSHPQLKGAVICLPINELVRRLLAFFSSVVSQSLNIHIYTANSMEQANVLFGKMGEMTNF